MTTQVPQSGWNQQTAAVRQMISSAFGTMTRSGSRRSSSKGRKTASATVGVRKRKKHSSSSKTRRRAYGTRARARLVKGSAAAKAYMAKIRKKRR